jgi:hypothetical protein
MLKKPNLRTLLLASALLAAFPACKWLGKPKSPDTANDKPNTEMPMPAQANNPTGPGDYAEDWKIVDSLEKQGLFNSALEKCTAIQAQATRDNKQPQAIKALLYRGKYTAQMKEDGFLKAVQLLENEEIVALQPQKSILQSMLGQLYATYLQNQGWRISERSPRNPSAEERGSLETWSAAEIEQKALDYYTASVSAEQILAQTPNGDFAVLLEPGQNDSIGGQPLRPSLYDLLAHRALDHFYNERSYLTQPAYAFQLDQPTALSDWDIFVQQGFETADKSSGKWLALKLFQKLLGQYAIRSAGDQTANRARLVDVDLKRLQFVHNNAVFPDKDALYRRALETLLRQWQGHPSSAEVAHQLAAFLFSLDDADKAANAKAAVAICETAMRQHPNAYGASQCGMLLAQIRATSLDLQVEGIVLPERPSMLQVQFRNLKNAHVRVVRDPNEGRSLENVNWEERVLTLLRLPEMQRRTWSLPDPGDYQAHRTELALDPLPVGHFWVLVSESEAFNPGAGPISFAQFSVSQLAAVHVSQNQRSHFVVADRASGQPRAGVRVELFQMDYGGNGPRRRLVASAVSNDEGIARPDIPEGSYGEVRISHKNDSLWVGHASHYASGRMPRQSMQVQFFTDRSLYRPGQQVYFKGILFQNDDQRVPQILPNQSVTLSFLDANNQKKASLTLRSNSFGSFNGAFTAPATGLTGTMRIVCDGAQGSANFNVEEYKRPKFEVTMLPTQGAYRLGERLKARGEAKNYAGVALADADIRYRIVRQVRYPFWGWGWFRRPYPQGAEMEIANGKSKTDANGAFEIEFEAIPDRSVAKKDLPVFDYQVMVDVTDLSGETRSGSTSISVGYTALQVQWGLDNDMDMDSLLAVGISTSNLAGQALSAKGSISVQRLTAPATAFLQRLWERPDLATIERSAWYRLFPDFAWAEDDNPEKWPAEGSPWVLDFATPTNAKLNLNQGKMQPGYYRIQLSTTDAFGEKVDIQKIVRVWSGASRFVLPGAHVPQHEAKPGERAFWLFGSGRYATQPVFYMTEKKGKAEAPRWSEVKGQMLLESSVGEQDRGGMHTHWFAVRDNRFYGAESLPVHVPWDNKDLQIIYETFRDQLAPGQQEEWRIRISGPKKDKVAAEVVAALYDASLDQFLPHQWGRIGFPWNNASVLLSVPGLGARNGELFFLGYNNPVDQPIFRTYPTLNWFDFPLWGGNFYARNRLMMATGAPAGAVLEESAAMDMAAPAPPQAQKAMKPEETQKFSPPVVKSDSEEMEGKPSKAPNAAPPIRRNLNETVFFFPELRTDKNGDVLLKFTMNEALTRWKLLTFAHSTTLQQALSAKEVLTRKELMVLPNAPRFLRAGDRFEFSAKLSNVSQAKIEGKATLNLLDANTLQPLGRNWGLAQNELPFSLAAGQSAPLAWAVQVPEDFTGAVTWQIFADGGSFKDGEESTLPVVSNRMLVTETLPIALRGKQRKTFVFDNFKNGAKGDGSASLSTHSYTLEFSSNPVWYAVQSLPYLMEFPHECSEQVFSRFYANTLASNVVEKMPNIRKVYERWKGTPAMQSNLRKNQELKYALLEETPWVMDAQNEEQQKQNIALLFDLNRMADERERAIQTLAERQMGNGGWPWFPGGKPSWYITQYIACGVGHLGKLGAFDPQKDQTAANMYDKALGFCDAEVRERYRELERQVQQNKAKWEDDHLDGLLIQYLYTRSFAPVDRPSKELAYYLDQAAKYWLGKGLYQEGMLALALHRYGRKDAAQRIVASLRERATMKEELGMYWPVDWGFYWYQLPVETQALMVEVFGEVAQDKKSVEELRIWLLKNKQTNRWESTKATAEAVYALLLFGDNWLQNTKPVQLSLGGKSLKPQEYEAGTGYFKQQWGKAEVKPSWAKLEVENPNSNIVWGAAYWQYFEDLDKIQAFQKTPLTIAKQLFTEENSPTGPVLKPVAEGARLKRGDKVKVRIEIRVDRPMEFVHLKDMRAAGFEPTNVLSGYRWQDGLGYYESTKDLATHFFVDYLPRGTFVFEYPLVVSHRGDMSNGIATMQCMYAPEFTTHSKGIRVRVE